MGLTVKKVSSPLKIHLCVVLPDPECHFRAMDMYLYYDLINQLHPPWCQKFKSILFDESCLNIGEEWNETISAFAFVNSCHGTQLQCELVALDPFEGLKATSGIPCGITLPDSQMGFDKNMWIGIKNAQVVTKEPRQLSIEDKSAIWVIPNYMPGLPFSLGHLFSGSFSGWEQFFEWMDLRNIIKTSYSFAIEADPEVVDVWQQHYHGSSFTGSIPAKFQKTEKFTIVQTPVQDFSWYNLCRASVNFIMTQSPPCQPWSLGGRGAGLESINGMCFLDGINAVKWTRPNIVWMECSDVVPTHHHYDIIKATFKYIGYRLQWQQISSLSELAGMQRARWLAVWMRCDIATHDVLPSFKLGDVSRRNWSDTEYNFWVPFQMSHQLQLTKQMMNIYGDFNLLPPSKRKEVGNDHSPNKVLQARCVTDSQIMPTLCASYTQQHELDEKHIREKGIFAPLTRFPEGFSFVDPIRFVAMFGATVDRVRVIPCKLQIAFHQLGNAIAVPHAALAVCAGCSIAGIIKVPVLQHVIECWNDRILESKTIVLRNNDFIFITPTGLAQQTIVTKCLPKDDHSDGVPVFIDKILVRFSKNHTFTSMLNKVGIEAPSSQGIVLTCESRVIDPNASILTLFGFAVDCKKNGKLLITISFPFELAFPTQSWQVEDSNDQIDDESLISVIKEVEEKQEDTSLTCAKVFIVGKEECQWIHFTQECQPVQIAEKLATVVGNHATPDNIVWAKCESKTDHDSSPAFVVAPIQICHPQSCCILIRFPNGKEEAMLISQHVKVHTILNRCNFQKGNIKRHLKIVNPDEVIALCPGDCIEILPYTHETPNVSNEHHHEEKAQIVMPDLHQMQPPMKCRKITTEEGDKDRTTKRIELCLQNGPEMGTDEMGCLISLFNRSCQRMKIMQPVVNGIFDSGFHKQLHCFTTHKFAKVVIPILVDNHWGAIEIINQNDSIDVKVTNLNSSKGSQVANALLKGVRTYFTCIRVAHVVIPASKGFCGWALVANWFSQNDIIIPDVANNHVQAICKESFGKDVLGGKVSSFAFKGRCHFFSQNADESNPHQKILFGGAEDEEMDQSAKGSSKDTDPWLRYDPWSTTRKQCRWEDLSLPEDHPFHDEKKVRLQHVHRHALNANNHGVAFCTRAMIAELVQKKPKQPFALIVPASDKLSIEPSWGLVASEPKEIIVQDKAVGTVYKRQIVMLHSGNKVNFELPQPGYKGTLTEKKELVLEVYSHLVSKESLQSFIDKPLETLKVRAFDQFQSLASEHANIYGFKKTGDSSKSDRFVLHAMCKVSKEARSKILEMSGAGDIVVRDFIPRGEQIIDVTVVPRFWNCDRAAKDEALRSAASIDGFAGIAVTKRGIAARAWCSKIANVRKILMAHDERINEHNINTVPIEMFDSTGWPISISPAEIVKAVKHSCSLPAVPTRCYRAGGVVTWTLGFEKTPSTLKFTVQFNAITYEILMTKSNDKQKTVKQDKTARHQKPVNQNRETKQQISTNEGESNRITALETKMAAIERRQDGMEVKLQSGFDNIQDQLRQVLRAVQPPRSASPAPTGCTPPAKIPKV